MQMLEAFSLIGSEDEATRRLAGVGVFAHIVQNPTELKYAVKRLIRGLESHKSSTRSGSYSTLSALLGQNKLGVDEFRDIVKSTLLTDKQTTKKERRLVYVARILACGVVLRNVPLAKLILDESLLKAILYDLVEMGGKRSTLLDLATPFICCLLKEKGLTEETFENIIWPCLLPLFTKLEVKTEDGEEDGEKLEETSSAVLYLALTLFDTELKQDFDFLDDMKQLVKILLSQKSPHLSEIVQLVTKFAKTRGIYKELWNCLVEQMRSSHFETLCLCVQNSVQVGIPQNIYARVEVITPILGVFRNEDAIEQHAMAVETLKSLLSWSSGENAMKKKKRKSTLEVLFGGSPNLLHEYKKLVRIINPFLVEVCTEKDLETLRLIIENRLMESKPSARMAIVHVQFLSKIAQIKKAPVDLKVSVSKLLLSIAYGKIVVNLAKHEVNENSGKTSEAPDDGKTMENILAKIALDAIKSLLASSFSPPFLDQVLQYVVEEFKSSWKLDASKKLFKKAVKKRESVEDVNLRYILGSYSLKLLLDQDQKFGHVPTIVEELLGIVKSTSSNEEMAPKIVQLFLSTVCKDEQPPFDYESIFTKLLVQDQINDECIQRFAESIDVDVDETMDDEAEEESSDDEDMEIDEDEDQLKAIKNKKKQETSTKLKSKSTKKINGHSKPQVNGDASDSEDGESSIDMDEATEDDLKNMDDALANVFAAKKRVKLEEASEIRSLMRTLRLLDILLTRSKKKCSSSIPLLLLLPVIHCFQDAIRKKKLNRNKSLSTRVVSILNKLNSMRKFSSENEIENGTFISMAQDLVSLSKRKKNNKILLALLRNSVELLKNCYLSQEKNRSKSEDTRFETLSKEMEKQKK